MRTAAILPILAGLAACELPRRPGGGATAPPRPEPHAPDEAPDFFADMDFMGTAASRAERAPYSPVGWPLQRGDTITTKRWLELDREFPGWAPGAAASFWIGKTVFGMRHRLVDSGEFVPDVEYIGHYPAKTHWIHWSLNLPDHLLEMSRTEEGFEEIAKSLFDPRPGNWNGSQLPELKRIWTREAWLDGYTGRTQ